MFRDLAASFAVAEMLVLCYHRIRSGGRFGAQMAVLAELGYSVLSLAEFIERLKNPQPGRSPAVLLTFDGCYADQLAHAIPVLRSCGYSATFFPLTATLGDTTADWAARRRDELRGLLRDGHAIGCHTHTHPDLTRVAPGELLDEVVRSKRMLEDALGEPVRAFCYPYGRRSPRIASVVREAGFDVAFTVDLGGVRPGDHPYQLKRVPVLGEPGGGEFTAYLSGTRAVAGTILLCWKLRERLLDLRGC